MSLPTCTICGICEVRGSLWADSRGIKGVSQLPVFFVIIIARVILQKLSRRNGSGMYTCDAKETTMEIPAETSDPAGPHSKTEGKKGYESE